MEEEEEDGNEDSGSNAVLTPPLKRERRSQSLILSFNRNHDSALKKLLTTTCSNFLRATSLSFFFFSANRFFGVIMSKVHLLEIEPKELKFIFELKKQSSCSVQLTNMTNHYVAFKVKTTSPKKYSVRPNVGVLSPKASCEFIVTMQAQRAIPLDLECRDKFLIQSTMVSSETASEDVTSSLKHTTDEIQSPEPMVLKNPDLKNPDHHMFKELLKLDEDQDFKPTEHIEDVEELKPEKEAELDMSEDLELETVKNVKELKPEKEPELTVVKGIEELKLMKAIEEMKLKLDGLESKLNESAVTISKLTEERRLSNQETKILQEKLVEVTKRSPRKVQVGFPFLYVFYNHVCLRFCIWKIAIRNKLVKEDKKLRKAKKLVHTWLTAFTELRRRQRNF
ncbi:hypothetical protein PIB30_083515 [Stylosanthes scabra]|uniref:MSP domain-containing protein n=1 Tax=Stylosanthes scabra TaxID=79078 RepID=A0ABU6XSU9_9FABA|nr:hypothetical protein [Stylosanthes scabra]